MGKLNNNLLREQNLKQFLDNMGVDLKDIELTSNDGIYAFNFKNSQMITQFIKDINKLLKSQGCSKVSIVAFVTDQIQNAIGKKLDKVFCTQILEDYKNEVTFELKMETQSIEIQIQDFTHAQLFRNLNYKDMTYRNGKLIISLDLLLKDQPQGLIHIEELSLVLLTSNIILPKEVVYSYKPLPDGAVEVTPYFVAPQASTPPNYHFVLDLSASMGQKTGNESALDKLKKSVAELINQLFTAHPDAILSLTVFSDTVSSKGSFSMKDRTEIDFILSGLTAGGLTALHQATHETLLNKVNSKKQNNILIFTDGAENASLPGADRDLTALLARLDEQTVARSKVFIFRYETDLDATMNAVITKMQGQSISVTSPDFMKALGSPEVMQRWSAARDLFKTQFTVINGKNKTDTAATLSIDTSGQIVALSKQICKPGEAIEVRVMDMQDNLLAKSSQIIPLSPNADSAKAMINIGLHAHKAKAEPADKKVQENSSDEHVIVPSPSSK